MVVEDEPKLRVQPSNTLGEYHKIPPAPNVSSVITDAWLMLLVADAALPSSVYIHTRLSIYEELNLYFGRKLNRKYWCIFRCVLPAWSFFFSGSSFSFHTNITEICPLVNAQNRGGTFV